MTRKRKLLLGVVTVFALLIGSLMIYLAASDLSGWRDTVARFASKAMDRELTISGEFEVDFGMVTKVHATEINLSNTGWGSETSMAVVDRLDGEINLWKLLSGSIHLPSAEIVGGRAIFESDVETGSNWRLGKGDGSGEGGPVRLRIDRIIASDITLVFGDASDEHHVNLIVETLDSSGDPGGMHQIAASGSLRDTAYSLTGRFGSFVELINLEPFDHDLHAILGSTELRSAGRVGRIADLGDLDLEATATIPQPTEIYRMLGLDYTFERPLEIEATASSTAGLTDFTLTTTGQAAALTATGHVDALVSPENLDVKIDFSGPDIRPIAALAGITDLDEVAFRLDGRVAWSGYPIEVTDLEIRVGENWISADGRIGKPPLMLETDFQFEGAGPNAAEVAALAGLRLPPDVYEIDCHLLRVENGLRVEEVTSTIGRTKLYADGFVGDPPGYRDTVLDLAVEGPNLAHYRTALGLELPTKPFKITGSFAEGTDAIALRGVEAFVGDATLEVDGQLTTVPGLVGTDLEFVTDGLDLLDLGGLVGFSGFPPSKLHAEGGVEVARDGYHARNVTGRIADITLTASGFLSNARGMAGSRVDFSVEGANASRLNGILPMTDIPHLPFRSTGELDILVAGYGLRGVRFELGDIKGRVDGRIVAEATLDGTDLTFEANGPSLAVLDPLLPTIALPPARFSIAGGLAFDAGSIEIRDIDVGLDDNTLRVDGLIIPVDGFVGTQIETTLEGKNLEVFGSHIRHSVASRLPQFPELPFSLSAGVIIDERGYHSNDLSMSLGRATASVNGVVGHWPRFEETDVEIRSEGPDATILRTATGADFPKAPFHLSGRVGRQELGFDFDDFEIRFGDYHATLDGRLGPLPKLIGTSLNVHAKGPDLLLLRQLSGIDSIPSEPFQLVGRFDGNPTRFKTDAFNLTFGDSDVSGDLRLDLEGKPKLIARLSSSRFRLADVIPERDDDQENSNSEDTDPDADDSGFVISNRPWDLSILAEFDADLDWTIGELQYLRSIDREFEVSVVLSDGRLQINRFHGVGELDGTVDGSLILEPIAGGHRIDGELTIDDGMLNLTGDDADPSIYTPADFELSIDASGRSLHEMLASANGRALITIEAGVMEKGIIDLISADVLVTVLNALNPFAKDDSHTNLNCAVLAATFENGVMTLDPAAIQTDKVTVLGDGTIDFATEKIHFDWITKPRKGLGISASMFTNPYIRLGGTLADPQIEMKPAEAFATTGVAVATMGISLVAKGFFDRVTAEKKVCEKAMKRVAEMEAESGEPDGRSK